VVVVDLACAHKLGSQCELTLENRNGAWAQRDHAILAGFGAVFVEPGDTGFVDSQRARGWLEIRYCERDLLGRA
jgi:hypothetical protein